jgi:citrate lyase subunit beta/citryl-CoA lyase
VSPVAGGVPHPEPLPRSFLYVPAHQPDLFAKATAGPADAVVLDLEDAVPVALKQEARSHVARWLSNVQGAARRTSHPSSARRVEQWVRIDPGSAAADLGAVVGDTLDGIFLAKSTPAALQDVSAALTRLEQDRGLATGAVGVIGLVESAEGFLQLLAMSRMPRVITFGIGEADLLGDLRMSRTEGSAAAIDALRSQVVLHCAAAGRRAPVAPTSTAFRDLDAFRESSKAMLGLGFRSRTAIHPGQVGVIHDVFTPGPEQVAAAEDVMARFLAAQEGVTTDAAGRLIDAAVVREARETLSRRVDVRRDRP